MCRTQVVALFVLAMLLVFCSESPSISGAPQQQLMPEQQPAQQATSENATAYIPSPTNDPPQDLYLLAATASDDWSYPVTLYRVKSGKLEAVREVLPQAEGVRSVRAWGNVIFLTHPAQVPKMVTVLRTDEPLRADEVTLDPDPGFFFIMNEAIGEPKESVFDEIMLATKQEPSPPNIEWLSVSSVATGASPRITPNSWDEYSTMRFQGETGGPGNPSAKLAGAVSGSNLVFPPGFGHPVVIDSLAPMVRDAINGTAYQRAFIVAASAQYLLLGISYSREELFSKALSTANEMNLFVHNRKRDSWKTIQVEGNSSRMRLFGNWLATAVVIFNPDGKKSPGQENERGPEAFGDYEIAGSKGNPGNARYPLVRGAFPVNNYTPGILVLQNLDNGQKVRVETGQEDSEILSVNSNIVFYRVNDSIYQARISGDQLQGTSVLVKGEDVPEIHWFFWGPPVTP